MRIIIDIADSLIQQWGALVVEPEPPVPDEEYKAPKVTAPGFKYQIPNDPNLSTFRVVVGPTPQSEIAPAETVPVGDAKPSSGKPDLKLHENAGGSTETGDAEPEPAAAEPSKEEKGGEVSEGDDK